MGDPRHNDIYYHITDVSQYVVSDISKSLKDYAEDICDRLVTQIEEILGYVFRPKPLIEANDYRAETPLPWEDGIADTVAHGYFMKIYRCSQDKASANYSKYTSTVPRHKQRRCTVEQCHSCTGRIRVFIPQDHNGENIVIASLRVVNLQCDEILLQFSHKCTHEFRIRKPVPIAVRNFIKDPANACQTASEMYTKVFHAASTGILGHVDMTEITDDNVRYWWSLVRKQTYQRHKDP